MSGLTARQQGALYVARKRRRARLAAALHPATEALLARMALQPGEERRTLIDALVRALDDGAVWPKLDVFYVLAAHDAQAARLNWRGEAHTLTAVNGPVFTADRGYAGNGASAYLSTGFNASLGGALQSQDSAHLGVYALTNGAASGSDAGSVNSRLRVRAREDANAFAGVNTFSTLSLNAGAGGPPHHVMGIRREAANQLVFRNGVQNRSSAAASSGLADALDVLRQGGNYSDRQVAAVHAGAALSDAQALALFQALEDYLQAIEALG